MIDNDGDDDDDDDDDDYDSGTIGGMNNWQRKLKYLEETCLSAALSQILHDFNKAGTLIIAVGNRRMPEIWHNYILVL
jgi:hypothetical protein